MKLITYLKTFNLFYFCFILFVSIFFKFNKYDIANITITSLSIMFGFALSFFLSLYSQEKFNLYLKEKGQFDKYINDNNNYIKQLLFCIILVYLIEVTNFKTTYLLPEYKKLNIPNIFLYITHKHLIFAIGLYSFRNTLLFLQNYITAYKNTYSERLKQYQHKKETTDDK